MITFQQDQCSNDKKLARDCKAQGLCDVWSFPDRLKDALDPVLLNDLMRAPRPLFTFDHTMAEDHTASIPDQNPGMVVVTHREGENPRTMTTRVARLILQNFKLSFPQWHQSSLNNSIITLSLANVAVCHVESGQLVRDELIHFTDPNWAVRLQQTLDQNVQRGSALSGPA